MLESPPSAYTALLFPAVLVLGAGPFGKSISFDREHLIEKKKRGQRWKFFTFLILWRYNTGSSGLCSKHFYKRYLTSPQPFDFWEKTLLKIYSLTIHPKSQSTYVCDSRYWPTWLGEKCFRKSDVNFLCATCIICIIFSSQRIVCEQLLYSKFYFNDYLEPLSINFWLFFSFTSESSYPSAYLLSG